MLGPLGLDLGTGLLAAALSCVRAWVVFSILVFSDCAVVLKFSGILFLTQLVSHRPVVQEEDELEDLRSLDIVEKAVDGSSANERKAAA